MARRHRRIARGPSAVRDDRMGSASSPWNLPRPVYRGGRRNETARWPLVFRTERRRLRVQDAYDAVPPRGRTMTLDREWLKRNLGIMFEPGRKGAAAEAVDDTALAREIIDSAPRAQPAKRSLLKRRCRQACPSSLRLRGLLVSPGDRSQALWSVAARG